MSLTLVVDDDPSIARALCKILESVGHEVRTTASAHQALAAREGVELAVIDVMMPGMNGIELAQQLRAERPSLPIIFVTGAPDLVNLADFPGAILIAKPWRVNTLLEAAEKLLGPTP